MKRPLIILLVLLLIYSCNRAQNKSPLQFTYSYANKKDSDLISLIVINQSASKTFYYTISLQVLNDSGWKPLLADINSANQNEFVSLKPIKAHSKAVKVISKLKIRGLIPYYKSQKIRFGLMYYEKKDFDSKSHVLYLPLM
jgi:hypothetical protein